MNAAELAHPRSARRPTLGAVILVGSLVLLGYSLIRFVDVAMRAVRFPYELDYGEGIVWQQMRLMVAGRAYAPVNGYPGIVFHYPPVYHSVVEAVAATTGIDALMSGRIVSLTSATLGSVIIGGLAARLASHRSNRRVATICGIFASLACFTLLPVTYWAMVMRVDMLAIFLSLAGLCFGLRSLTRPAYVYAAAFCFVGAVFTKQIAIAAPAATFGTLLIVRPAAARRGILTCLVAGSAVLAMLAFATHGGILRHLFLYNVNRFDPVGLELLPAVMLDNAFFFTAVAAGILFALRPQAVRYWGEPSWIARRAKLIASTDDSALFMITLYFIATILMALLVVKSGANINYLVEWLMAAGIFAGFSMRDAVAHVMSERETRPVLGFAALLPAALGAQAVVAGSHAGWQLDRREEQRDQLDRIAAMISAAPRAVISDDMVLLQRGGKDVVIEPAIFAELTGTGRWDERPLIRHILAHDFSFFVTEGDQGAREFDSRYTPAVASAMHQAYPIECRVARYTLHLPFQAPGAAQLAPISCAPLSTVRRR